MITNSISLLNKGINYNFSRLNNNKNIVSEILRSEATLKTLEIAETRNSVRVILKKNQNSTNTLKTSSS